ncbi:MAG: carbohydrate ABC transporter permease [Clostridiales bacterium]|nr:carbohydrate ABC transporter permease [Clostridiales bacterium]
MKISRLDAGLTAANFILLGIFALAVVLPFWEIICKSFMSDYDIMRAKLVLWPKNWQIKGYITIFNDRTYNFGRAFINSVIITAAVTLYQLAVTSLAAYALTKKTLPGRKLFMFYIVFTMYFGGGLIPYYILLRSLGLLNKILALIIPQFFSVFNALVMMAFFKELPEELFDAAKIDGAGNFKVFAVIVLPLSKAVLATIALFIAVGTWNNWFTALLFIQKAELRPIAYTLQIIIERSRATNTEIGGSPVIIGQSVQYAAIVVALLPIMAVYPFLQKHFTKGVMIGSVKG